MNMTKYFHLVTEYGIRGFVALVGAIALIMLYRKLRNHWMR